MTHLLRKTIMASNFLVGARGGVLPCIPNQPCQSIYQIVNLNTNRQTTTHFSPVIPYSKANKQNKISVKNKSIESFKSIKISLYQCWTNNFNIKFRKGCLWFIRRRCLGINTKYQKEMSFFFVFRKENISESFEQSQMIDDFQLENISNQIIDLIKNKICLGRKV